LGGGFFSTGLSKRRTLLSPARDIWILDSEFRNMNEETVDGTSPREKNGNQRLYIILFGGAVLVGMILVFSGVFLVKPYQFNGSKFDPPSAAPDFTLTDQNGNPYHLAERAGKVVLIFFGYTNCPDICPTTLAEFKQVHELLGEQADQVDFIFVTIDPERDSVDRLANYLPVFGDGITGLTGSYEELEPVWKGYGVIRNQVESDSAAGYLMEHSTRTYGIDRNGNLRVTYLFGTTPESILRDTQYLLSEG
jgi:protein SCO1